MLPGFEWLCGLYMMGSGILTALLGSCFEAFPGHNQVLFGLALCLPMIGHFLGLKIMYDYYGRPGFTWRISLNVLLIGFLACAGFAMAMEWTKSGPAAVASRQLRCG